MTTKWLSTCGTSLMLLHKPNNSVKFAQKFLVADGQANKYKCSWPPGSLGWAK